MGPFVGRVEELAALGETADAVVQSDVAAATVVGEPGSGKSRLLAEVAARAECPNRFRVVGYEPERHVPLAAAVDLLRALGEAAPAGRRFEALMFNASQQSSALEPVRVFESAHRAFRVVGPAVVLVDDLQWVDELSLALCHYLLAERRPPGRRSR